MRYVSTNNVYLRFALCYVSTNPLHRCQVATSRMKNMVRIQVGVTWFLPCLIFGLICLSLHWNGSARCFYLIINTHLLSTFHFFLKRIETHRVYFHIIYHIIKTRYDQEKTPNNFQFSKKLLLLFIRHTKYTIVEYHKLWNYII